MTDDYLPSTVGAARMPAVTMKANSPVYDLLDAHQIADELGVSVKTVRRWMSTGQLRSAPIGNRRLTRREDLTAFLHSRIEND